MPRLTAADENQLRAVMAESWELWGAGLAPDAYDEFWRGLRQTAWARRNLRHMVWADDDGSVLSSVKVYRPAFRWSGGEGRCTVFGAVFTPASLRGRGHASAMIRHAIAAARTRGDALVLLFSDIDPTYYEALGFQALPAEETNGTLGRSAGTPEPNRWTLRPMSPSDFPFVERVHRQATSRLSFALDRDARHWEFLWKRAESFFRRLDGSGLEERYSIALDAGRPAGYLIAVEGGGEWHLREAAAEGDSDGSLASVLRAGARAARSRGRRAVVGWLPRRLGGIVPEWRLSWRPRPRGIPMVLPLDDGVRIGPLLDVETGHVPYLDQF